MTTEHLIFWFWWPIGFACALAIRFFMNDYPELRRKYRMKRKPLTWDGLLKCILFGFAGLLIAPVAALFGGLWLIEWGNARAPEFMRRPVFPPR